MRLKRLEMVGFKSFAERTRVEFEPGITAIVGPNGCGKSNISDAIRWSLGEMSAKSLRSGHMLDVIFNGTANRAAQGLSEVSLTFDNTAHQIPIDYSEVTISRRLFRSGESEYFVNKTQCRLKDLRDLFLDTGVGNDGYYMMAQGKIEFILSSKPEERRELFEEAAGVSKYKARREEALRRLNKVEQDMLRLNDSLAIYKQQMDSLDAAVRKAKQHQKLQDDLKTLEIVSLLSGYQKAQADWEHLHAEEEAQSLQFAALRQELDAREAQLAEARAKFESAEQDVIELQKKASQCDSELAKTEAELQAAQERAQELEAAQGRISQEAAQLESSLQQWRQSQSNLSSEVEAIRKDYHEKNERFKEEDRQGHAGQNEVQNKQRDLEQTKARLLELVRLISHHRNETVRLTSLSIRQEEATKAKQRELEKVQMRRSALEEQIQREEAQVAATQDKLSTIQNTLRSMVELHTQDQATLAEMEQMIYATRERLARLEAEKQSIERWLGQDPVALAVTALKEHNMPGIYGPISELFKTGESHQRLLDRALGDRASCFVADTLNDAQEAIRYLSESRKGWATFILIDHIPPTEGMPNLSEHLGSSSLAVQVQCDEKFMAVKQFLLGKTYYVGATLFEETILQGGADPEQESYQATPADLARLTQEMAASQTKLQETEAARDALKTRMIEREGEKTPLQDDEAKTRVTFQVQQETLGRIREDLQMNQTEERLLAREREESLQTIAQAQQALAQEEILLTTLEDEERTLQETVQQQDLALQELRQSYQAHQMRVSQFRLEAETLRERLLGKEKEEENARGNVTSLDQRLQQMQQERTQNDERLQQLSSLRTEKTALLDTLRGSVDEQRRALTEVLNRRQENQQQLHQDEGAIASLREQLSHAQARAQEAEFKARALEQDRQRLEQALQEMHQLSVDDAKAKFGEIPPNPEELARVRKRLENLGAVNLAAPEEHAQLEERYQFLLTQQQDLLKAKDDLHQAIAKINGTTREQFKTTFEQVRANFKQLYQTLFQGGEADVVLTDEHNLLETGVEIVAQPPGKKLQSIALLSGGEKALTAIALLFAFFMVKPSPFCLLDEVDAPLDEANVGRFLRMVKSFSEKTQFIVITHNKRTMEMADILYGVTMAELGVSSLISMKLESREPETVAA